MWRKFDALTDEEVEQQRREDPDAPDPDKASRMRPVALSRRIRFRLGMSQATFAETYALSLQTLKRWERYEHEPSKAHTAYLYAIDAMPEAVAKAVADGLAKQKAS
ncbi:MAG: transcriptional regulator [Candidatus Poribacteria bacterium]|nr:transcriptional regulator [Candidatus Poribacteria bacterium]